MRVRRCKILGGGLQVSLTLATQGRLSVQFVDDFGRTEAGIDAGGLFKEFWTELSKRAAPTRPSGSSARRSTTVALPEPRRGDGAWGAGGAGAV